MSALLECHRQKAHFRHDQLVADRDAGAHGLLHRRRYHIYAGEDSHPGYRDGYRGVVIRICHLALVEVRMDQG